MHCFAKLETLMYGRVLALPENSEFVTKKVKYQEISAFAESCGFGEIVHCKPLPTLEGFGFDKHICREHLPAQEGFGSDLHICRKLFRHRQASVFSHSGIIMSPPFGRINFSLAKTTCEKTR